MSRIAATFTALRARGEPALIPYFTAGDPDLETTRELVRAAVAEGASAVELGVPFSDPMADGPVLQRSATRALAAGTTLPRVLELVADLRRETSAGRSSAAPTPSTSSPASGVAPTPPAPSPALWTRTRS